MSVQIQVKNGIHNGEHISFLLSETIDLSEVTPAGKMITDSERTSFVYLIDGEDAYGQIHFPKEVWPLMVEAMNTELDPFIVQGEDTLQLNGFIEELEMLIFNIEGNSNYGKPFTEAVEEVFEKVLKEA